MASVKFIFITIICTTIICTINFVGRWGGRPAHCKGYSPCPMIGEGAENGHTPRPSNNSYENNPDKNPDAVNGHIPFGRPPAPYKGLMIFVKGGEAYAEQAGHKHERDASKAINIEGESNCYGQNKIFRNMAQLADIVMDTVHVMFDLFLRKVFVQDFIRSYNDFLAEL